MKSSHADGSLWQCARYQYFNLEASGHYVRSDYAHGLKPRAGSKIASVRIEVPTLERCAHGQVQHSGHVSSSSRPRSSTGRRYDGLRAQLTQLKPIEYIGTCPHGRNTLHAYHSPLGNMSMARPVVFSFFDYFKYPGSASPRRSRRQTPAPWAQGRMRKSPPLGSQGPGADAQTSLPHGLCGLPGRRGGCANLPPGAPRPLRAGGSEPAGTL